MNISISQAYRLLTEAAVVGGVAWAADPAIDREILEADDELSDDVRLFSDGLGHVQAAFAGDGDIDYGLMRLRGAALNIFTVMSNPADEIEKVVVARRDRPAGGN